MMQFPATNFHDLNLDWMLQQIKTMMTEWSEMQTDFSELQGNFNGLQGNFNDLEDEWETEKAWMHNYVQTNLPTEVQTLFNAFIETPAFESLVQGAVSDDLIVSTVDTWLATYITQETGYVLDSSLTSSSSAAQAKAAGDRINAIQSTYFPVNYAQGTTITEGKYVNADTGNVVNSSYYNVTGFIDITGLTDIIYLQMARSTFTASSKQGVAFYDADENFIDGERAYRANGNILEWYRLKQTTVPTAYKSDVGEHTAGDPATVKYIRLTLAPDIPEPAVVYSAANYTNSLPGEAQMVFTNKDSIDLLNTRVDTVLWPAKLDFPLEVLHRGMATDGWPENTIVTYKHAIDLGWKWLETDLRRTSDGVWVLCHTNKISGSAGVARNPDGSVIDGDVYVSSSTYSQLLQYDFGIKCGSQFAGTKIATLEELMILCKMNGAFPHVGIKESSYGAVLESALAIADKYDMTWRSYWGCASISGIAPLMNNPKYKHVFTGGISDGHGDDWSGWSWIDPADFAEHGDSAVIQYLNGENQVVYYWAYNYFPADATHTSIQIQDNFIDWCHYWGLLAGTYAPTTEAGLATLSPRFDVVMEEVYHYTDVMTGNIPTTRT